MDWTKTDYGFRSAGICLVKNGSRFYLACFNGTETRDDGQVVDTWVAVRGPCGGRIDGGLATMKLAAVGFAAQEAAAAAQFTDRELQAEQDDWVDRQYQPACTADPGTASATAATVTSPRTCPRRTDP
jgi:hypothetical protein